MLYANPIVGRTGLCNMLCPWARAVLWARDNDAKVLAPHWTNFLRIGPLLRREKSMRWYLNDFTNVGYVTGVARILANFGSHFPEDSRMPSNSFKGRRIVVDFSGMNGFIRKFFKEQQFIKQELCRIVNPDILARVSAICSDDFIAVHVRRGDFKGIGLAVSNDWYIKAIQVAKSEIGDLPVWIFSDDSPECLEPITHAVEDAKVMPSAPAVHDLLCLSRAKFLVGTSRSSFSYWAAYLGQMQCVWNKVNAPNSWRLDGEKPIVLN